MRDFLEDFSFCINLCQKSVAGKHERFIVLGNLDQTLDFDSKKLPFVLFRDTIIRAIIVLSKTTQCSAVVGIVNMVLCSFIDVLLVDVEDMAFTGLDMSASPCM